MCECEEVRVSRALEDEEAATAAAAAVVVVVVVVEVVVVGLMKTWEFVVGGVILQ
jgi:hypothetical protein